ncbi:thioredoxin-dependent thiol peroxidase [uncultured Spirosoma sp.]|uniref:thioredoxin-dependent thiol peroxidase n=1 Tax=uncultured Spirosoma sp. TaxID=278208 RepID=UPI002587258F|nr:thioredoxin-dependent thiol peroxidase [uncultured Spirosoma sp.]
MLTIGDTAPDFASTDQNGDTVRLSDYRGRRVALYFYPKDNTPGCTAQACSLRDRYSDLQAAGYEVLGVSTDSQASHRKFADKYELPFRLVADTDKQIVNAYGVWQEKSNYGRTYMGIVRTTFVIDEQGIITDIIGKIDTKNHANQLLG